MIINYTHPNIDLSFQLNMYILTNIYQSKMLSSRNFLLNDNKRDDASKDRRFFFQIPLNCIIRFCTAHINHGLFCSPDKNGCRFFKTTPSKP